MDCETCSRPLGGTRTIRSRHSACYHRELRAGTIESKGKPGTFDELLEKAREGRADDECWPWPGYINKSTGYAEYDRKSVHRRVFVEKVGPLDEGMEPDHTCHSSALDECAGGPTCPHRRCANWNHMESVTRQENWERSNALPILNRQKTGCPVPEHGPYDRVSTSAGTGRKTRWCSKCTRASHQKSRAH